MKINLLTCLLIILSFSAISQNSDPIVSSRPGQAFVPNILDEKAFQLQSGIGLYVFGIPSIFDTKSIDLVHNSLLRYGLSKKVELRTSVTLTRGSISSSDFPESNTFGFNNIEIGMRYNLIGGEDIDSKLSIQADIGLPFRPGDFNSNLAPYELLLIYSTPLSSKLTLTTNVGLESSDFTFDPITRYVINLSFPLSDKLSAFVENYGNYIRRGTNQFDTFFDGGFALLVHNDLQIDLSGGFARNKLGPESVRGQNWFVDAGVSIRFP